MSVVLKIHCPNHPMGFICCSPLVYSGKRPRGTEDEEDKALNWARRDVTEIISRLSP